MFFAFRRPTTGCFQYFFLLPRGWKATFFSFSFFQGVGKPLFSVFRSSKGSENHFFLFFVHPRGWKATFFSFLFIQGVGKPIFSVFRSSEGSESHFFRFFVHPRPRTLFFLAPLLQLNLIFKPNSWNKWLSWSFVQIWNVFV